VPRSVLQPTNPRVGGNLAVPLTKNFRFLFESFKHNACLHHFGSARLALDTVGMLAGRI